jgi:hypothetical protein
MRTKSKLLALCTTASSAVFVMPHAIAEETSHDTHLLPLAVQAQMNLGQAGLMSSFSSGDTFGGVQWRIGQARTTIGKAKSSSSSAEYKDGTSDAVIPLTVQHALSDGKSLVRLNVTGTLSNGGDNEVQLEGDIGRVDAQYIRFLDVNTMLSFGVFGESTDLDIVDAGTIKRHGAGLRFDMLSKFSDHWGAALRTEYSWGEQELKVAAGPFIRTHKPGDDHFYLQSELVGTYHNNDFSQIPEGWALHPVLGMQFQRNFLEKTADSFGVVSSGEVGDTENYGTVWGHFRFEKETSPGSWTPNMVIGMEQEYVNDLDEYVDEPTYAVFGGGVSIMERSGNRYELSYLRHQGLKGNRSNEAVVLTATWNL